MCRQPENCRRHMECACYCSDKVSAIGRQPPVHSLTIWGLTIVRIQNPRLAPCGSLPGDHSSHDR